MTYYDILEVSEKASQEVIRMAYKALCKKYHPDVYQGDKSFAEEQMKKINEAYETLSDETKKRQYDYSLNIQSQPKQNTYYEPKPQEPRYQPRQEDRTYNIKSLLELGFDMLKNGNRFQADRIFDQVLAKERNNAEAYLGKLMVELGVKNRNSLKNCRKPFNDKPNYQKALLYADNSLKEFLIGTIQHINKRNYETECQNTYRKACAFMLRNDGIQCFQDAIAEFEKIRGYKDSNQRIEKCYQKIAEIKSATLAAEAEKEKQKEERKEKIKASLPIAKKIAMFVVPVLVLAIIAATVLPKINWNDENVFSSPIDNATSDTTSENILSENSSSFVSSEQANIVSSPTITSSSTSGHSSSTSAASKPITSSPSNNTPSSNTPSTSKPTTSTPSTSKPTTSTPTVSAPVSSSDTTSSEPNLFENSNEVYITEGDFKYRLKYVSDTQIEVYVTGCITSSTVNIPLTIKGYTVNGIDDGAFANRSITSISLPNGITSIGNEAFSTCTSLTSISLPNSVTILGNKAFAYCSSLTSISLPSSITSIEDATFFRCRSLKSITIPNSVTNIGAQAFAICESLQSVTIPNSVTSIGNKAFRDCTSLQSVTIPNSVTSIGDGAFEDCSNLSVVYFQSEAQKEKFKDCFNSKAQLIVQ